MASIIKRPLKGGGLSWTATVRIRGYSTRCQSFPTRHEAELWAARTEAAAYGRTLALGGQVTVADLLTEVEARLRDHRGAPLKYWRAALGSLRVRDVSPALIAAHRDQLLGAATRGHGHKRLKPRSASTVRTYLAVLAAVFKIAVRELRYCDANPVHSVAMPKQDRGRTRFLSADERARLLAACQASESSALYPFVLFALTTGARKGEISGLRWANVDLARRWAIFSRTKNGDARGVPLTPAVVAAVQHLARGDRVFHVDITKAWHTAVRRAELMDFRFHDLRHSAASHLVQSGANLAEVAQLLGHKDIRMTARYSHVGSAHTTALVDRCMGGIGA